MQLNTSLAKSIVVLNEGFSYYLRSIFEILFLSLLQKCLYWRKLWGLEYYSLVRTIDKVHFVVSNCKKCQLLITV